MRISVRSCDASGNIDPTITGKLIRFIPGITDSNPDVTIIPVSYLHDYKFDPWACEIKGPIVLMDFVEFGWRYSYTDRIGLGLKYWPEQYQTQEWEMLDQWVAQRKPELTFKRELHRRHMSDTMIPVEFPMTIAPEAAQSREEFNRRPMEIFHTWGYSHPMRRRLHGEIFTNADAHNLHIIDALDQHGRYEGVHNWATIHIPHYNRRPISEILRWQRESKISVAMPGAGVKCFRHGESMWDSIMALAEDELAWSYPWIDRQNCIRFRLESAFTGLLAASRREDLFDTYMGSRENMFRYHAPTYAIEYVLEAIKRIA